MKYKTLKTAVDKYRLKEGVLRKAFGSQADIQRLDKLLNQIKETSPESSPLNERSLTIAEIISLDDILSEAITKADSASNEAIENLKQTLFQEHPKVSIQALKQLPDSLITLENLNALSKLDKQALFLMEIFQLFNSKTSIITQALLNNLFKNASHSGGLSSALKKLKAFKLLTKDNIDSILARLFNTKSAGPLLQIISVIPKLNQPFFTMLLNLDDYERLGLLLADLTIKGFENIEVEDYNSALKFSKNEFFIIDLIYCLKTQKLLTESLYTQLKSLEIEQLNTIGSAILTLSSVNLLSNKTLAHALQAQTALKIIDNSRPMLDLSRHRLFKTLIQPHMQKLICDGKIDAAGPLNSRFNLLALPEHTATLKRHLAIDLKEPDSLYKINAILSALNQFNLLTVNNVRLIYQHYETFTHEQVHRVFSRVPQLTQEQLDQIFQHATQEQAIANVAAFLENLVPAENNDPAPTQFRLNDSQSTHTTSVHASVSKSAKKLFEEYNLNIQGKKLDAIINQIQAWLKKLNSKKPPIPNIAAAYSAINRLSDIAYVYTDIASKVSIRQLLGLVWMAIHDKNHRKGTLDDAKSLFIEALYEIQRGYNISNTGTDLGGADRPICVAGSFNKLIEKLNGLHSLVEIKYLTKQTAAAKLPCVVKEEVLNFVNKIQRETPSLLPSTLKKIKTDNFKQIWEEILPHISNKMFKEFGELYNGKTDPEFIEFIDAGIYTDLSNLELPKVSSSKTPSSNLGKNGLFLNATTDDNSENKPTRTTSSSTG